jgi:hypothetical protein
MLQGATEGGNEMASSPKIMEDIMNNHATLLVLPSEKVKDQSPISLVFAIKNQYPNDGFHTKSRLWRQTCEYSALFRKDLTIFDQQKPGIWI